MPSALRKTTATITKAPGEKLAKKKPIKGTSIEDAVKAVHEARKNGLGLNIFTKMTAVIGSTVLFHLYYKEKEMVQCYKQKGVTEIIATRINYLEILSGTSENRKLAARKFLRRFAL